MNELAGSIDLGSGFSCSFFQIKPDRRFKANRDMPPNVKKAGLIIYKDNTAIGNCPFDLPEVKAHGFKTCWELVSLDPIHIEPSIQTYWYNGKETLPEYHGHIRNGKWKDA